MNSIVGTPEAKVEDKDKTFSLILANGIGSEHNNLFKIEDKLK